MLYIDPNSNYMHERSWDATSKYLFRCCIKCKGKKKRAWPYSWDLRVSVCCLRCWYASHGFMARRCVSMQFTFFLSISVEDQIYFVGFRLFIALGSYDITRPEAYVTMVSIGLQLMGHHGTWMEPYKILDQSAGTTNWQKALTGSRSK